MVYSKGRTFADLRAVHGRLWLSILDLCLSPAKFLVRRKRDAKKHPLDYYCTRAVAVDGRLSEPERWPCCCCPFIRSTARLPEGLGATNTLLRISEPYCADHLSVGPCLR